MTMVASTLRFNDIWWSNKTWIFWANHPHALRYICIISPAVHNCSSIFLDNLFKTKVKYPPFNSWPNMREWTRWSPLITRTIWVQKHVLSFSGNILDKDKKDRLYRCFLLWVRSDCYYHVEGWHNLNMFNVYVLDDLLLQLYVNSAT